MIRSVLTSYLANINMCLNYTVQYIDSPMLANIMLSQEISSYLGQIAKARCLVFLHLELSKNVSNK